MPAADRSLSVLIASPEIVPYAKTGGLGDVIGSLPGPLARLGAQISLVMPAYRCVLEGFPSLRETGITLQVNVSDRNEAGTVLQTTNAEGVPVYLVKADRYFDREYLYGTPDGDYPDNPERFTFFSRAVLEVARHIRPQVLHAHDWQTALSIAFLKSQPGRYPELARTGTVMTIHNLGYQGRFEAQNWHLLNLDRSLFVPRFLEFYGDINFLKAGSVFADSITTVSPTYAQEIQTSEQGFGLEGVFRERSRSLYGILNGVDYSVWDPEGDPYIARRYSLADMSGKDQCKAALQKHFGLRVSKKTPLLGMVTRLSSQKGLDLVSDAARAITNRGCQLVVLGSGDRDLQTTFQTIARQNSSVGVEIGFSEAMAHRVIAGSDFILVPSLYEPCGLTQLYALKYGAVPIVRMTGGLKDTVLPFGPESPASNGFVFSEYRTIDLLNAIDAALAVFNDEALRARVVRNAMGCDFSWTKSAGGYLDVYRRVLEA
jgi:starch synthase